jgi:hypothetical protein
MPASVRHLVPGLFVLELSVLPLVALWLPLALWGWLGMVGLYALGTMVASMLADASHGWSLLPLLPLLSCGLWLRIPAGAVDFGLVRR